MTTFAVRQSTDGVDIDDVIKGSYDEASIEFDKPPRFSITIPNPSGVQAHMVKTGKEIQIRRNGELRMTGVIETPDASEGSGTTTVTFEGMHKGYKLIQQRVCDSYDFDEDGDAATTRDAVTINPWRYFIFRKAGGTLDIYGNPTAVDGVRVHEVMRCLIGTKFIFQHDFQDNSIFLGSQVYATTNTVQVYRDAETSDLRPVLQRIRNGPNFLSGTSLDSIPLENGDINIDAMGTISTVNVMVIGTASGSDDPTIQVCRNARQTNGQNRAPASRTYTSCTLARTDNYLGTGMTLWAGDVTLTGSEDVKNSLGFKITVPGTGGTETTKVHYIKLSAVTTSDTGLSEGTISTYVNPTIAGLDNSSVHWVDTDFQGMERHVAIERLRKLTESSTATNSSPHWDAWIDGNLAFHFKQRRGSVIARTYSFANENLKTISHEFYGGEIGYQTIAYGAGSGVAQTRIVSKTEFASGGLYTAANDPASGASYGQAARILQFVDPNEKSAVALLRKARAFHKLHRAPIENVQVEVHSEPIRFFDVGDSITISNLKTRTNASIRVVELTRSWSGSEQEKLSVKLGEPIRDFTSALASNSGDLDVITIRPQPHEGTTGLSGNGVYFDKDKFGVYSFGVNDGASIERVFMRCSTLPWQATSKANSQTAVPSTTKTTIYNDSDASVSVGSGGVSTAVSDETTSESKDPANYDFFVLDWSVNTGSTSDLWTVTPEIKVNGSWGFPLGIFTAPQGFSIARQNTVVIPANLFRSQTSSIDGARLNIVNSDASTRSYTGTLTFYGVPRHSHNISFGIYQFDGDSGNGTGAPTYGTNIKFAVDPDDADADGIPTTTEFNDKAHPVVFGKETGQHTVEFDITGYMAAETNGIIKNGEHKVFFKSTTNSAPNAQGLAVVSVTPVIKYREVAK